jgi:hypothetical protein
MRRTIELIGLAAVLAVFAVPAFAQQKECTDDFKSATYQKWYDNRKDHQDVAYEAAKEYLSVCTAEDAYTKALNNFKTEYERLKAGADIGKQFEDAVKNAKYADQVRLGKLVLANDPDNVKVYIIMAVAGLNDASLLAESSQYAKKAIELISAGKPFAPLFDSNQDKALANLNYAIAKATATNSPTDAIPYYLKALRLESDLKKNPAIYAELAGAYGSGPVAKLHDDYQKFVGLTESTESKLVVANLNQAIDRQIDALARAAALAATPADKKNVMDVLSGIYTDRYKNPAGLNELVASVLTKPLPDMPTPITSLPSSTSGSTPASGGSSSGTSSTTSSNTGNGQNKTGVTGANATNGNKTTTGASKPTPTPTPPSNKQKPRRAHHVGTRN